ncbi:hypothetical protein TorRG33x02_198310 [Trema orientale]|uniref:Uncharacterized protein n=1 Tax=Trema orientale TaxID=63057 RepID=A0A2P5EFP7_TREOI|nr:hypothetical protein TorRG33x02_198310 [Trema orientale]
MKNCTTTTCAVRGRMAEIYQWPKADSELLGKSSDTNCHHGRFSTKTSFLKYYDPEKYYTSRQNFLRSYKFTKKETLGTRTKNWLKMIKSKTVIKSQTSSHSGSGGSGSGCPFYGKGVSLRLIVSCMTKPDVRD